MVGNSNSYSCASDHFKTEPLEIRGKWWISIGFRQNGRHFVQNGTKLENRTQYNHWNAVRVWYSSLTVLKLCITRRASIHSEKSRSTGWAGSNSADSVTELQQDDEALSPSFLTRADMAVWAVRDGCEATRAAAEGCKRWNCGIRGMTVFEIVLQRGQRNSFLSVSKLGGWRFRVRWRSVATMSSKNVFQLKQLYLNVQQRAQKWHFE